MVARLRDLSAKYRTLRRHNDALFDSLTLQTLLNKFIKRGKKAVSRRALYEGFTLVRLQAPNQNFYPTFFHRVRELTRNVKLILVRKGKQFLPVPVPAFRTKATISVLQQIATYVTEDKAFDLPVRVSTQLSDILVNETSSLASRELVTHKRLVHEASVNMDWRWK